MPSCEHEPTPEERGKFYQDVLEGASKPLGAYVPLFEDGKYEYVDLSLEQADRSSLEDARKRRGLEPHNVSLIVRDLSDPASRRERLELAE